MRHFPVFLDLKDRHVVIVGGGDAAVRKLRLALAADPAAIVVAPRICKEIQDLVSNGAVKWKASGFAPADLDGAVLAFAATGCDRVDREVSAAARLRDIPVNAPDRPDLSSFIMPAIVDRAPITIAISSAGAAPVLARRLRARLESMLPARLGDLARFADRFRGDVKAKFGSHRERRRFWERFFDGSLARRILAGETVAGDEMRAAIGESSPGMAAQGAGQGAVAIVGAGPGDPELLTFKALQRLQEADVILYDKLVGPDILTYARRDAERIYVGKSEANHTLAQESINALLAERALAGQRVVRLKGGDPFVFGRGGEEMAHLSARGIPVEIVPGVTAAAGCAAVAGIPLTLRGVANAVTFLTGHAQAGRRTEPDHDWAALVAGGQTLVFYMGLSQATTIARRLVEHGMKPETPVAIIESGTLQEQRIVRGAIAELNLLIVDHHMTAPALIVVGAVAATADRRAAANAGAATATGGSRAAAA